MKRVVLCILAVLALTVAGGAIYVTRMDTGFIVRRIAEVTEKATGAPLVLEAAPHLSLLPPGVRFGAARWSGELDGNAVAVSVKGGMARLELEPLFSGHISISEIRLDRPEADIRLAPRAGQESTSARPGEQAPRAQRKAPGDAPPFELARLTVGQGSLHLADGASDIRISGFNLSLENLRRREEVALQGDMALALAKDAASAAETAPAPLLEGNLAVQGTFRYYAPNLTFRQVSLAFTPLRGAVPRELAPLQLTCEGAFDLAALRLSVAEGRLTAPQARLELKGDGTVEPPTFAGEVTLTGSAHKLAALAGAALPKGAPDAVDVRSRVDYSGNDIRLAALNARAAGLKLDGDLTVGLPRGAKAPLSLRGALQLGAIVLDPWLAGGNAATASPAGAGQGAAGGAPAPRAGGNGAPGGPPSLDLRVTIAELRYRACGLRDLSTRIAGDSGAYTASDLSARLTTGGALKGSLSADLKRSAYLVSAQGTGIDIGALCSAAGKPGLAVGTANVTARLQATGTDAQAILASLDGSGLVDARDVSTPGLREAGEKLRKPPIGVILPDRVTTLRVPFTVRKGELTAPAITATARGMSMKGELRASLVREYLEGSATIAGLGVDIPLSFKGPFGELSVSVDPRIALEIGRRLLPGAQVQTGPQPPAQANPVDRVRDGVGKAGDLVRGLFGR